MKRIAILSLLALTVAFGAATFAYAGSGSGSSAGSSAAAGSAKGTGSGYEDFNPAGKEEQVNAPLFVTIAYSVIWLVPLIYLIGLWRRQARLRDEVASMRRELGLGGDEAAAKR